MLKKVIGLMLVCLLLNILISPSLISGETTKTLVIELSDSKDVICHSLTVSASTAKEIQDIMDEATCQAQQTTNSTEQYNIYTAAVDKLYSYGVFEGLTLQQARHLATFWYREPGTKSHESTLPNQSNINCFCLVSGHTSMTFTTRLFSFAFMALGGLFLLIALLFIFPYPTTIFLFFALVGNGFFNLGVAFLERGDANPLSFNTFFDIGFFDKQANSYLPGLGEVTTHGMLGQKTWSGYITGALPGRIILDETLRTCPAIYGFSGIKIWMNQDGSEKSYLGSAVMVGIQEA